MSAPTFSEFPPIPQRSSPEADFDAKMYALFQHFATTHRSEMIAAMDWVVGRGFGWGTTGRPDDLTSFDAVDTVSGVHRFTGATEGVRPPNFAAGQFGYLRIIRAAEDIFTQVVERNAVDDLDISRRKYNGGVWSEWVRDYGTHNILGTVSESGGAPTGAVIESGSNGNGQYVAWADGTLICTNDNTAITAAPATFVGAITKVGGDKLWVGRWTN